MYPLSDGLVHLISTLARRRLRPNELVSLSYCGMRVYFRGLDSDALEEVLFLQEYAFLESRLRATDRPLVIDVGSHVGTFGIWVLGVNPMSEIVGIEANPATYNVALKNIPADTRIWKIYNLAAYSCSGARLHMNTDGPSMGHSLSLYGDVEVASINLRDVIALAGASRRVSLLKIDVEGAEEAFLCANPTALKNVESLVVELHPGRCDADRVRRMLEAEFDFVHDVSRSASYKPLLYCYRNH